MRKTATVILGVGTAALLFGSLIAAPTAMAQGKAPDSKVCNDKEKPPTDAVTLGGCNATDRTKGNCTACHMISGAIHGNLAPPLVSMKQRFPDKAKLRAQVWDATASNKHSVMPPYGRHSIISEKDIDNIVEFLLTL